jgi:hypothetical protein
LERLVTVMCRILRRSCEFFSVIFGFLFVFCIFYYFLCESNCFIAKNLEGERKIKESKGRNPTECGSNSPHRDHSLEAGCHSFMSLAIKKGGSVAITLYLQPMVFKTLEQTSGE